MLHLKTVKDAHEKQRAINMNMCMADFIAPEHRFRSRYANSGQGTPHTTGEKGDARGPDESSTPGPSPRTPGSLPPSTPGGASSQQMLREVVYGTSGATNTMGDPQAFSSSPERCSPPSGATYPWPDFAPGSLPSTPLTPMTPGLGGFAPYGEETRGRSVHRSAASDASSDTPEHSGQSTEADHQRTFDRAAYLLRQALDLEQPGGGGVVLFDTNALSNSAHPGMRRGNSDNSNESSNDRLRMPRRLNSSEIVPGVGIGASRSAHSGAMRERVVLAAASVNKPGGGPPSNFGRADATYKVTLTPPELQRMCKKHPRGKLFHIPDNVGTSLFDWEGRPIMSRLSAKFYELVLLRRQFPQAKQVIFVPMFHANLNRWTSCFAFTNSRYRVFTYEMDYLPSLSFANLIRSEIARLGTVLADQQKSDFIGSVSHELRSPLHGILASIEFLQDTECDNFQTSCIDTMDACAHTLLDTISMVLDYNKVNTMTNRTGSDSQDSVRNGTNMPTTTGLRQEPLFVTDTSCDVALITEEVVDGLAMGHLAKVRTNMDFDDTPTLNSTLNDVGVRPSMKRILNAMRPEVEIILDIQGSCDWYYATQPGAIRRIVMNLFGNSLKYTKHGSITISLRVSRPRAPVEQSVKFAEDKPSHVKITVKDTGQGISPEYLRTKIFTAFAQENAKAAGTGLGLSIVKSIVNLLHGEIDIKSIVNVGTMVTVTLPMKKTISAISRARSSSGGTFTKDSSIYALQNLQSPPQTAIYEPSMEFDSFGQTHGAAAIHSALTQYLTGWFAFPVMQTWDFDFPATLLIVDEIHLPTLLVQRPDFLDKPSRQSMIILCANPARQSILSRDIRSGQVEVICKPFGPFKLAKTLNRAIEKAAQASSGGTPLTVASLSSLNSLSRHTGISATHRSSSTGSHRSVLSAGTASSRRRLVYESPHAGSVRIPLKKSRSRGKEVVYAPEGGYPFPIIATPPNSERGAVAHYGPPTDSKANEFPSSSNLAAPIDTDYEPSQAWRGTDRTKASIESSINLAAKDDGDSTVLRPVPLLEPEPREPKLLHPRSAASFSSSDEPKIVSPLSAASFPSSNEPKIVSPTPSSSFQSTNTGALGIWDAPSSSQTRKPRLLLVDDNKLNLQLLHTFMKKRDYGEELCQLAEDGSQAVGVFESFAPDVVFMDISMPIMDGIEATRQIRKLEANRRDGDLRDKTPIDETGPRSSSHALVVALTGNAKSSDQAETLRSGVDVYMTKPVSFKQVGKLLENWRENPGE